MEAAPVSKNTAVFVPLGKMPSGTTPLRLYAVAIPLFGLFLWVIFKLNNGDPLAIYIVASTFSLFFYTKPIKPKGGQQD